MVPHKWPTYDFTFQLFPSELAAVVQGEDMANEVTAKASDH